MNTNKYNHGKPAPADLANRMWLRSQLAWAEWMDKHFRRMNKKRQYALLSLFVALSLTVCFWLVSGGLAEIIKNMDLGPTPIKNIVTAAEQKMPSPVQDTIMQSRIQSFHSYMDSLSQSPSGRIKHDSILNARPGLLDSIRLIEKKINNRK